MDYPIVSVTGNQIVAEARKYMGVKYTFRRSFIWLNPDGSIHPRSKLSCIGFALQVAKDCGMIGSDYSVAGPRRSQEGAEWDDALDSFLATNFTEVAKEESIPGDLIKMSYRDLDHDAPYHVGIKTTFEGCPAGKMIHSFNYDIGGDSAGSVTENRLDFKEWARIITVHRYKGMVVS